MVAELFRRYANDGASIADLTRWLTDSGTSTRTGENDNPIWPHRDGLIWPHLRACLGASRHG